MKVLDANFLIDYLNGHPAAETYYESNRGDTNLWMMPTPAYAEVIVGLGNLSSSDVEEAIDALSWGEVYRHSRQSASGLDPGVLHEMNRDLAVEAGRIADEIGPQGPYLDGVDALVAAVGRKFNAPVVSSDSDLTHEITKQCIEVEEYR